MSYNGFPFTLTAAGCQESAADRMGPGYITRGILVDMPLMKKREVARAEHADLCRRISRRGRSSRASRSARATRCSSAAGRGRSARPKDRGPYGQGGAGLHASVLPWLRARDVSLLASDAVNDVQPSGVEGINRPIHQLTQVNMGLPIVDNAYLEDAAVEAAR